MLKKLLKPKNFSAVMRLLAVLAAVAALFVRRVSVSDEKGRNFDIYKLGRHAAFAANKKPKSAAADLVKSYFAGNL